MTLKSKCAFDIAAKLPVEQPLTERELLILGLTVDYCGQHFRDVIEDYDAEREKISTHARMVMT